MMTEMMKTTYANPSSVHSFGRESKIVVENARKTIANLLNTSPGSIFLLQEELKLTTWQLSVE